MKIDAIDIVLPCYRPQGDWEKTILCNYQTLQEALPEVELFLYLVSDGSAELLDPEALERLAHAIPHFEYMSYAPNRGKGYALRQGVARGKSSHCIYTDVDFPYTTESFCSIYQALCEGEDVVIGLRNAGYYAQAPWFRRLISKILRFFIRLLLRIPITDTQGGLKGFSSKGREVFLRTRIDRYLFDLEFVFLSARESGLRLVGREVSLRPNIVFSKMNWRVILQESRSFLGLFWRSLFSSKAQSHEKN